MFSYVAIFHIFTAGVCFMLSNLAMKQLGGMPWYVLYGAVGLSIMIGAWFEVQALREIQLGHAVATILSAEILLSIAVAAYFLHEHYTARDLAGMALIIVGIVMLGLSNPPEQKAAAIADDAPPAMAATSDTTGLPVPAKRGS